MPSDYKKRGLTGSTDGLGIKVAATSTAGTLVHTAITTVQTAGHYDEVWLYAWNSHSAEVKLTIEFGGDTDPDDIIELTVGASEGLILVIPGLPLQNTKVVRAFAATGNVICIYGYVHLITE